MHSSTLLRLATFAASASLAAASPSRWSHGHDGDHGHHQWEPQPPNCPAGGCWPQTSMKKCVVASSGGAASDAAAIAEAFASCSANGIIEFAEGVDYNMFEPVVATNLSNVIIHLKGNLHLPQNISYIQGLVSAAPSEKLHWMTLEGDNIQWIGSSNISTGWVYSYGDAWWKANAAGGTGTASRPRLMHWSVTNGYMEWFKSMKPIAWGVQLAGNNVKIANTIINAMADGPMIDGVGFPFNTDGFDISGTDIEIADTTCYNGDDAFSIEASSHNVHIHGGSIGFQCHGMSVGSLGQDQAVFNNVSDIVFEDFSVIDAVYASRFKSWVGGQGLVKNVTWKDMRLYNVTFPIFVTQTYVNQGSAQTQRGGAVTGRPNNSTVMMEDFTWSNFVGTINQYNPGDGSCVSEPCWYNNGLPDLAHTEAVIIECNTDESCSNFRLENINVVPQSMTAPTEICFNATAAANPDLGMVCHNGTFVPI